MTTYDRFGSWVATQPQLSISDTARAMLALETEMNRIEDEQLVIAEMIQRQITRQKVLGKKFQALKLTLEKLV